MGKNKKKEKTNLEQIRDLKKLVWTLMEHINELEAAIAAKKKGV